MSLPRKTPKEQYHDPIQTYIKILVISIIAVIAVIWTDALIIHDNIYDYFALMGLLTIAFIGWYRLQ